MHLKKISVLASFLALGLLMFSPSSAQATGVHPPVVPGGGGGGGGFPGWPLFICVGGIITSAIHISRTQNRELTQKEALSCGLYAWASQPKKVVKKQQNIVRVRY